MNKPNNIKDDYTSFRIPQTYCKKGKALFFVNERELRPGEFRRIEEKICSQIPYIVSSFIDVDSGNYYYELIWHCEEIEHNEIIPASYLAIKRELVTLSNKSLAVTDNNAKDLIKYFDLYKEENSIPRNLMTKKIGRIKMGFIHPLKTNDTLIMPSDDGEKQLLNSFQCKGKVDEWIENVFVPIKSHPKALLMVVASFASVLLAELKMEPFIVDFAGETSNGKTTLLKVCASVWGTSDLIGEWNITKVSLERKAAFLNSFPILLDDTRKANEKEIKDYIYSFSGGREKGRGSLEGSRNESSWSNILLSTGEVSLNDYVEHMGGAAARIIALEGLPFDKVHPAFFNELHKAISQNYGEIGLEFINCIENKEINFASEFATEIYQFQERSFGNPVVSRISRNYAALFYTAKLLNRFFKLDMDLQVLINIFDEMIMDNKALNKPKQLLELLLQELDANRKSIYYDVEPNGQINAIYKGGGLWLTPKFLNDFLGAERTTIRKNWLRNGYTLEGYVKGKLVDYHQMRVGDKNFQVIGLSNEVISQLGFNFSKKE